MALTTVQCTHCGAMVTIERTKGAVRCPFCDCAVIPPPFAAEIKNEDFLIRAGVLESYLGQASQVTIPDGVCRIGDGAFSDCVGLTEVVIPDTVRVIGVGAFAGCEGLTALYLPDGVATIEEKAFLGCFGLTSLHLPESVTEIGSMAFLGCYGVEDVCVPERWQSLFPPFWKTKERQRWQVEGKCAYCGSKLEGRFRKKCPLCGWKP